MILENRLILQPFFCREFGYDDISSMLAILRTARFEPDISGMSGYASLLWYGNRQIRPRIDSDQFVQYDANILEHSRKLRMTQERGRTWKPHQYLAMVFTEHYLNRYFTDPEKFCTELNYGRAGLYKPKDLRTLAFQSATGSGKTLIMHAHILQYRHYLSRAGGRLNNVVLVTPNEQMSQQHEREMRESGLHARLFSKDAAPDLFSPVEIIDLNKLAEKQGVKRVAVSDFGEDNLVLVDEGHLGTSGNVWRERRKELAAGGFTFEYSATFNQVVTKQDKDLLGAYSKCLLFDYPYRWFHADGYGKDYSITNLPDGAEDENSDMYLLGCLLTFYQQCRIWREKAGEWQEFNPAKPLWVFLGKTVIGSSKADQATRSDIIRILRFLGWVLARGDEVRPMMRRLLDGKSGLLDDAGRDCFAGRFEPLEQGGNEDLYADLCQTVFHGAGRLHVVYLTTGEGELHLRTADNDPFGVVNVGDSAGLYKLLVDNAGPDLDVDREMGFAERLFAEVDRPDSTVNIVIGARRFIAGWSSWRVSTMGLMHVGVGEGPEIIQMFGRGVRLKGWNMTLKRHLESGADRPDDSGKLKELEKLYIFGLRANYMQTFRNMLQKEGLNSEQETFTLPVTWNFARETDLKLIRLKKGRRYDVCTERPALPGPNDEGRPFVTLDLYSRLQSVASTDAPGDREREKTVFRDLMRYADFFNVARIHDRLLARKRYNNWRNLIVEPETVEKLLRDDGWYTIYIPPDRAAVTEFRQVQALEEIAVDLIAEYADQYWRKQRRRWEHKQIEIVTLTEDDPNKIDSHKLSVDATKDLLIQEARDLEEAVRKGEMPKLWYDNLKVGTFCAEAHAYEPLLYASKDRVISVEPVPLDESEKRVVSLLAGMAADPLTSFMDGKELFLIRNLTRGRGVSFFDDFGYYPDFIVWIKDGDAQHVVFLDPKGLARLGSRERKKIQLHHEIAEISRKLHESDPNLHLHAYILSVTEPEKIDDGSRSREDWKRDGVYFSSYPSSLAQIVEHAFSRVA